MNRKDKIKLLNDVTKGKIALEDLKNELTPKPIEFDQQIVNGEPVYFINGKEVDANKYYHEMKLYIEQGGKIYFEEEYV